MKTIILGNAGAGKTTLARHLLSQQSASLLPLDDIAFAGGIERRPVADSIADARAFIETHDHWVIEGCYADIVEALLPSCETLLFLNPGIDACVGHCRARPWEPDKFPSPEAQDAHLDNLVEWVRAYSTREDEYGLRRHRELYEGFDGNKRELTDPDMFRADAGDGND